MNKSIWQELCSHSAGDVCQLAVDYCIITDREHTELITAVQELALNDKSIQLFRKALQKVNG